MANLYFCHYCVKLHRWHRLWSKYFPPWYEESMPYKQSMDKHFYLLLTCHIPYYYARLAMNRHFYGPAHGPPSKKLRERAYTCYHPEGVVDSMYQQVHIVDDQLLVLSVVSMSHSRGDSPSHKSHLPRSFPGILMTWLTVASHHVHAFLMFRSFVPGLKERATAHAGCYV